MKKILLLIGFCLSAVSCKAEEWFLLVQANDKSFIVETRVSSLRITKTVDDKVVVASLFKVTRADRQVFFEQSYVSLYHCGLGYGSLVTTDLEGKPKFQNDFVFDGGNVASYISKYLCSAYSSGLVK